MIFGGVGREHLQLNEATLWAGGPYDPSNTNALAALPEARKLVFAGKYDEAHALISSNMMAVPLRQMPYETLGDLCLDFGTNAAPVENYRRDLDLDTAVASVSYTANGVHFKREMFASAVDQVIVDSADGGQAGADFLHRRPGHAAKGGRGRGGQHPRAVRRRRPTTRRW